MMHDGWRLVCLLMALSVWTGGCERNSTAAAGGSGSGDAVQVVALGGNDVKTDGMISPSALHELDQHASDPALAVNFIRAPLSDAGLAQLEKYHNLRRVEAIGSRVTDAGARRLQKAVPGVEVVR